MPNCLVDKRTAAEMDVTHCSTNLVEKNLCMVSKYFHNAEYGQHQFLLVEILLFTSLSKTSWDPETDAATALLAIEVVPASVHAN